MASRLIDVAVAAAALPLAAPLCVVAAAGIWLSDGRPLFYKSLRVGLGGRLFTMYKFRTMRSVSDGDRITGARDHRVFRFGRWLRRWKVDELPQLFNVLRGDMAIVGPRPEDPGIVDTCYGPLARETLTVRPGLASPGSIYNFTHGEDQLDSVDVEGAYITRLLPRKLAFDLAYVRRASWLYDVRIVGRAAASILAHGCGRRRFPEPAELSRTTQLERELAQEVGRMNVDRRRTHPDGRTLDDDGALVAARTQPVNHEASINA